MENETGCLICGSELEYISTHKDFTCIVCAGHFRSNVCCPDGHYICDNCHSGEAVRLVEAICQETTETDPAKLLDQLLHLPAVKMHGPEHHYIVPAVLVTIYNKYGPKGKSLQELLKEVKVRSGKVDGGFCGSHGTCGAGIGAGIAMSVLTSNNPLAGEPWSVSNKLTGQCLIKIAEHGGPRCCKRDAFISLIQSIKTMNARFGSSVEVPAIIACDFDSVNRQCTTITCPFYHPELNLTS